MILVPQKRKCFASAGVMEDLPSSRSLNASSVAGTLETGTDSPAKRLFKEFDVGI